MRYLYILGASGSGKTTLAKKLAESFPEIFNRVVQHSTREIREGEVNGVDYNFITEEEYDLLKKNFFETVETQYYPKGRYGGLKENLVNNRVNLVVACIEGLLSGIKNSFNDEIGILNIICNGESFVEREGRNVSYEEIFNKSVIYPFLDDDKTTIHLNEDDSNDIRYFEIDINDLRNMDEKNLKDFIMERLVKCQTEITKNL